MRQPLKKIVLFWDAGRAIIYRYMEKYMSLNFTRNYVLELEELILEELLPIYERYHREKGIKPSYKRIHPDLIRDIKQKKTLPALLKPKENHS